MKGPIIRLTVDNIHHKVGAPILIGDTLCNIGQIVECVIDKHLAFRVYDTKNILIREVVGPHKYIIDYYDSKD